MSDKIDNYIFRITLLLGILSTIQTYLIYKRHEERKE